MYDDLPWWMPFLGATITLVVMAPITVIVVLVVAALAAWLIR